MDSVARIEILGHHAAGFQDARGTQIHGRLRHHAGHLVMNGVLDPEGSAALWYGAARRPAEAKPEAAPEKPTEAGEALTVEVWLFGLLATATTERPVILSLRPNGTGEDVMTALEARIGAHMMAQVKNPGGGLLACCRVIVDGAPIEDMGSPIIPTGKTAKIEMILFKAFEGG